MVIAIFMAISMLIASSCNNQTCIPNCAICSCIDLVCNCVECEEGYFLKGLTNLT